MKVTRKLRTEIYQACRENVRGSSPLVECGLRGGETWGPNTLNWDWNEMDLGDLEPLSSLKEIDDCPAHPGCAALDCYVTTGAGSSRELECNVYVAIRGGRVVAATCNDLASDEIVNDALGIQPGVRP